MSGLPARLDQPLEHLDDPATAQRGVDFDRETRAGELVDDSKEAKAAAVVERAVGAADAGR
jgi:hypothetical protein